MMMTKINQDIKIAVAQFGDTLSPELETVIAGIGRNNLHWYYFDETADKEFELGQLKDFYDEVYW
jgi:hypothetical protein